MSTEETEVDYYAVLGIKKNATLDEIKKAFRKLSMIHHPDKTGGDDTKFKELGEAYGVLSDPEKRPIYDEHGSEGLKQFENHPMRNARISLQPLVIKVECNLSELFNGASKKIQVKRTILEGNIKMPDKLKKTIESEMMDFKVEPCTTYGERTVLKDKGNRHKTEDLVGDLLFVIVPPGSNDDDDDDEKFPAGRLRRQSEPNLEHKGYTLEGLDLHYKCKLNLSEALVGFKINIEFLDASHIMLSSSKTTQPGTVKVIPGMGFKKKIRTHFGMMDKKGDLHLHFDVSLPETLDKKQQKHIIAAIGLPRIEKTEETGKVTQFKVDDLKPPSDDNEESHAQQIFIGGGGMPGMPGMHGMPPGMHATQCPVQ